MAKKTTIRCPHCSCEYLPAEIYYPKHFVGTPSNIIKDENGAVLGFNGSDMETSETFTCDNAVNYFPLMLSLHSKQHL